MTLPFTLPDWLPWWSSFALLVILGLYGLAFLLMPFSVFGLKGRLDAVEARLDEIQGEIRSLALRLPEAGGRYDEEPMLRPPIPPAPRIDEPRAADTRVRDIRPALVDRPPPPANRPVVVRGRPDASRGPRAEPSFDPN